MTDIDLDKLEALDMPGMTVTLVRGVVYQDLAIRKWDNDGLEGGTHRLVAEPVARSEIARLRAEIERLRKAVDQAIDCLCTRIPGGVLHGDETMSALRSARAAQMDGEG